MSKLLSANFYRLKRDKGFWVCTAVMLVLQMFMLIDRVKFTSVSDEYAFNDFYFEYLPLIGFLYAVFISLFLGREYSDGTIRNKLIVGHTRLSIYFSNYIVCLFASLAIYLVMILSGLLGIPFLGKWQGGTDTFILYIIMGIFITAVLTAVLTMLAMLCSGRAVNAIVSMAVILVLMIIASVIYNSLAEPEFTREFVEITEESGIKYGPEIANPAYASGVKRKIFEFLLQFLPSGQGILIANGEVTRPLLNIAYSAVLTVVVNITGAFAFKKKDLK